MDVGRMVKLVEEYGVPEGEELEDCDGCELSGTCAVEGFMRAIKAAQEKYLARVARQGADDGCGQ